MKFFKKKEKNKRLIDYRKKYWGHSLEFTKTNDDNSFQVYGWCSDIPKEGDELLHKFKKGIGVCVFLEVRPCNDPKDMFFAKIGLIRYATDEDYKRLQNQNKSGINLKMLR